MSGIHKLVGKNAVLALKMLKTVTNFLDEKNISYCLKAGTLLGIIRENRLLPWDNDMDICITEDYYDQLLSNLKEFKKLGYIVWTKEFSSDNAPFKKGMTRIVKLRNRRLHFIRGEIALDIFIKFKLNDQYHWQAGNRKYSVPAKYHDELTHYHFDNKDYFVPKDYEGYLSYKYGDWKVPVKEWNPFKDDKAIVGDA